LSLGCLDTRSACYVNTIRFTQRRPRPMLDRSSSIAKHVLRAAMTVLVAKLSPRHQPRQHVRQPWYVRFFLATEEGTDTQHSAVGAEGTNARTQQRTTTTHERLHQRRHVKPTTNHDAATKASKRASKQASKPTNQQTSKQTNNSQSVSDDSKCRLLEYTPRPTTM